MRYRPVNLFKVTVSVLTISVGLEMKSLITHYSWLWLKSNTKEIFWKDAECLSQSFLKSRGWHEGFFRVFLRMWCQGAVVQDSGNKTREEKNQSRENDKVGHPNLHQGMDWLLFDPSQTLETLTKYILGSKGENLYLVAPIGQQWLN